MNVLFLTHRLPYAPNRGDRVRAFFLLRQLSTLARVTVLSLVHDDAEAAEAARMAVDADVHTARVSHVRTLIRSLAALPTATPLTHTLLDSVELTPTLTRLVAARRPDVVLAYCSGMARLAFSPMLRGVPLLLDMVDVDSAKWADLSETTPPPHRWIYRRESRLLRRFEAQAATRAIASMVVTERERQTLAGIAPHARVEVVPNGIDVDSLRPPAGPCDSAEVVFCGVMNYGPNEQAACLLAENVWPIVRRRRPDARLTLVGASPSRGVRRLDDPQGGITVTGPVSDVRPYLWRAAAAAAPLRTARGIQNKVLEAVTAGLPTVVTPNVLAALPDSIAAGCRVGDTADDLAEAILAILDMTPLERRALATLADPDALRWEHQLSLVPRLLDDAQRTGTEGRS